MVLTDNLIDGKYTILEKLGNGGTSTVYKAINKNDGTTWALKEVMRSRVYKNDTLWENHLREVSMLKKLRHKNLPAIADVIDYGDNYMIVMDYIEGVTLEKLVNDSGAQSQDDVVGWAIQLCDVLDYLHTRKPSIIYRDMKPSNIMLRKDGEIVLIDFGTAREYKDKAVSDTMYLGTRGYAAPEQFGGKGQTDARTDIYCIGATMYHLLTGFTPCELPYDKMPPITQITPNISKELEAIINTCIQEKPDDRFQSARELKEVLENFREFAPQRVKGYKKAVGLLSKSVALAAGCLAFAILLAVGGVAVGAAVFMFYAVILSVITLCIHSLFDIRHMKKIIKTSSKSLVIPKQATPKAKTDKTKTPPATPQNGTIPLPHVLAGFISCIITASLFSTTSNAAETAGTATSTFSLAAHTTTFMTLSAVVALVIIALIIKVIRVSYEVNRLDINKN
jgi:serine/threonine protein kinase